MEFLIIAYLGFGFGMSLNIVTSGDKVLFKGKELSSLQMFLFILLFSLGWPSRFFEITGKYFQLKLKSGTVVPL